MRPANRVRALVLALFLTTLLVAGASVGAGGSGPIGPSTAIADVPTPGDPPSPTDAPPPPLPCDQGDPSDDCVMASDEIDLFEDDAVPSPTPTTVAARSTTGPARLAAVVPCGHATLLAILRGPRGARIAALGGGLAIQSFIGGPFNATARRATTLNGAMVALDNDGGPSIGALFDVTFAPRAVPRPIVANYTESGGAAPGPFFITFGGRRCAGARPLSATVRLP